ncbi:hypothetical protein MMC07_007298 [Pseudocyphellaria aurata]|nr:hypothetical protein [Pseudocyphellaria aurata]
MRPRKPKRVAPRVVDINGGDDGGRERKGGGIGDGGGLAAVVDGAPERWQVRWIHKILADEPQNDDTLLFQAMLPIVVEAAGEAADKAGESARAAAGTVAAAAAATAAGAAAEEEAAAETAEAVAAVAATRNSIDRSRLEIRVESEWVWKSPSVVVVDQVHAAKFPSSPGKGGKADLQNTSCR